MPDSTIAGFMERVTKAGGAEVAKRVQQLRDQHGDRPPFSVPLPEREQARQYGGGWYVRGQATGKPAEEYWAKTIKEQGPRAATKFNTAMLRLNSEYPGEGIKGLSPELMQEYGQARATGQHPRTVYRPKGGTP